MSGPMKHSYLLFASTALPLIFFAPHLSAQPQLTDNPSITVAQAPPMRVQPGDDDEPTADGQRRRRDGPARPAQGQGQGQGQGQRERGPAAEGQERPRPPQGERPGQRERGGPAGGPSRLHPRLRPPHPRLLAFASSAPPSSGRPPRWLRRPRRPLPPRPGPRLLPTNRSARPRALRRRIDPRRVRPGPTVPIPLRRELARHRLPPLRPRPLRLQRPLRAPSQMRLRPRHRVRLPHQARLRCQLRA